MPLYTLPYLLYTLRVRVQEFSLKNRFLAIFVIAFVLIGVSVYFISKYQIQNFLVTQDKKEFQEDIQNKAEKSFNLELPLSLRGNNQIPGFVKNASDQEKITGLKLLDSSGQVLYSASTAEIGQNFTDKSQVKNTLAGNMQAEKFDAKNNTVFLYIPIKSVGGDVRGVLLGNFKLDEDVKFVNTFALQLDGLIGLLALFFGIAIYIAFVDAEADLTEKDHSLVDQSKAYQEEKQLDDAIIGSMAESLVVVNKDGQIMLFNPETEKLTGYSSSEVEYRLYRKILAFTDKDGKEIPKNPITESLKTGEPVKISVKDGYFLKDHEKNLIPVSVSVAPILSDKENIQGVAATIQDISTEKELNKVKDEFVYVVAHELGNPIFALDGYLGIIQERLEKGPKETKNMIDSARAINQQLSGLVNDLLEVVRNEQGTLKFDLVPVDLDMTIKNVLQNAQFKAKDKKIELAYKESRIPKIKGDPQKIKEVITNLVDNAIKYTPEGGKIEVWHEHHDHEVTTHIKDNGFGISKTDQEKLFEKFYRIKTEKTASISGTGLGLFICKQIIEKCGGTIWVDSEEGKGSTFSFLLKTTK